MFNLIKLLCFILLLQVSYISIGQVVPPPVKDTLREFEIIRGPSMRAVKLDSATTLQTIAGGAIVKQGNTLFYGDSLVINPTTHTIEAFGNIEINQGDSVFTYSQYLKYLGQEKIAHLTKNVKLTDKKGTLFTQDFDYNLETGIGNFHNGGKVIEGKNVITSVDGTYYADTKDVYFKKNVKLDGPKNHVRADSLLYNMQTKQSTFISETHIKNAEVDINTTQGTYDLNTGNAFFTSRTKVKDSSGRIYTANNMALENKSGNAQLEGDAVIIDSANGFIVIGNQIFINKKNNSFLATRKPVLIIKQKSDSMYVAADTIFSGFSTAIKNEAFILTNESVSNDSLHQKMIADTIQKTDSLKNVPPLKFKNEQDSSYYLAHVIDSLAANNGIAPNGKIKDGGPPGIDSVKAIIAKQDSSFKNNAHMANIAGLLSKKILEKERRPIRDSQITANIKKDSVHIDSLNIQQKHDYTLTKDSLKNAPGDSISKSDSTRYFLAFHHVRIFSDSLQSVCDSLYFSTKDSVFRLYYEPVVWSGHTQIAGDTIYLFTKNKHPERLYVFDRGMIVNRTKEGFYNQMAGKTINGYFIDGKIDYMRVKGTQAESIYYMQDDDSAYIGMNRATGDVIDLYFKNEDLNKVLFINEIKGTMYPMTKIPEDQRKLKNFEWLDDKRPKNKLDLFE